MEEHNAPIVNLDDHDDNADYDYGQNDVDTNNIEDPQIEDQIDPSMDIVDKKDSTGSAGFDPLG